MRGRGPGRTGATVTPAAVRERLEWPVEGVLFDVEQQCGMARHLG